MTVLIVVFANQTALIMPFTKVM